MGKLSLPPGQEVVVQMDIKGTYIYQHLDTIIDYVKKNFIYFPYIF